MFKNKKRNLILAAGLLVLTAGVITFAAADKKDEKPSYGSEKPASTKCLQTVIPSM